MADKATVGGGAGMKAGEPTALPIAPTTPRMGAKCSSKPAAKAGEGGS